ncbi:MotA/TolQ/ExbB proton channel family protein [Pelagibaculum spongiae]|uniref:Flagellar motor protein MotA n=1 Tax=Pelagibaculum spongiae TaxID=2080658 RepID=A0A2V1GXQ4_9GAMM|nr:MotA/TolQ/ExbB proton channel family protein [Pelagibaculum spongiae]PVZ71566.1 flagellar motor protein MotA [Pelagibaculum spongiae]
MLSSFSISLMHQLTNWLLEPVIWLLILMVFLSIWEAGQAIGERFDGLKQLAEKATINQVEKLARKRIERADFITRISPMLGLMGTLIPLGPGLAALGDGELKILTTAMTVAFDTTVMGLLAGIFGFVLARLRRRWYSDLLDEMDLQQQVSLANHQASQQFDEQTNTPSQSTVAAISAQKTIKVASDG